MYKVQSIAPVHNGIKHCLACNKRKYTTWFNDAKEYSDGKLPICMKCYKTKKVDNSLYIKATRTCKQCNKEQPLYNFANGVGFTLKDVCNTCSI